MVASAVEQRDRRELWNPVLAGISRSELVGWLLLIVASTYLVATINDGWWPHDDGALAQGAARVLAGQIPHRDFVDPYTGGLNVLNALAMVVAGETLMALRLPLALFGLIWLIVVYRIARRFAAPWLAGLVVLAMAVWSLPNYPTPMPSWYLLFLATFAFYFGLRFRETLTSTWMLPAGACAGLSFLLKSTGGLLGLALVSWLLWTFSIRGWSRVQVLARFFFAGVFIALGAYPALHTQALSELYEFSAPLLVIGLVIAFPKPREATEVSGSAVTTLLTGAGIPLAAFMSWLLVNDAVAAFVTGIFVAPLQRLEAAAQPLLSLITLPVLISLAALFALAATSIGRRPVSEVAAYAMLGAFGLWWLPQMFRALVEGLTWSVPLLVILGIWSARKDGTPEVGDVLALGSLVLVTLDLLRFPFSALVYFMYVAPFAILVLLLLAAARKWKVKATAFLLVGIAALALGGLNGATLANLGDEPQRAARVSLSLQRAGSLESPVFFYYYTELVQTVEALVGDGTLMVYGDAPEIHFLTKQPNPGRHIFDFLGREPSDFVAAIHRIAPDVVVVKMPPDFSAPLNKDQIGQLDALYDKSATIGPFLIVWDRQGITERQSPSEKKYIGRSNLSTPFGV